MRYNSPNSPIDGLRDFVTRGGIPVTMTLLFISVMTFFNAFFSPNVAAPFLVHYLLFNAGNIIVAPWTVLTYPLFEPSVLTLLISGVFFWLSGGSLERSWGSSRYAGFLAGVTAVTAFSMLLGGVLFHQVPPTLSGLNLPLGAVIMAFCMLNPEQTFRFYFFPLKAKYIAVIVAVMTLLSYGPIFGVFACGGLLAALVYVRYGRSWATGSYRSSSYRSSGPAPRGPDLRMDSRPARPAFRTTLDGSPAQRRFLDFAGRWKDWQERRRLEKLWKNSGFSTSETEWRDDEKRRK